MKPASAKTACLLELPFISVSHDRSEIIKFRCPAQSDHAAAVRNQRCRIPWPALRGADLKYATCYSPYRFDDLSHRIPLTIPAVKNARVASTSKIVEHGYVNIREIGNKDKIPYARAVGSGIIFAINIHVRMATKRRLYCDFDQVSGVGCRLPVTAGFCVVDN